MYLFKRVLNSNEISTIKLFNDVVEFNYTKDNSKISISLEEKDKIITDIFNVLNNDILYNFIDFKKLLNKIKSTYIKHVISNGTISLSLNENNNISVVLVNSNLIIGEIKIDYDVKVKVEEIYLKDTLILLEEFLNMKNTKRLIKK